MSEISTEWRRILRCCEQGGTLRGADMERRPGYVAKRMKAGCGAVGIAPFPLCSRRRQGVYTYPYDCEPSAGPQSTHQGA